MRKYYYIETYCNGDCVRRIPTTERKAGDDLEATRKLYPELRSAFVVSSEKEKSINKLQTA